MTIPISNVVVTTDTFQSWIDVTNQVCDAISTRVVTAEANTIGGSTSGNVNINGILSANTIAVKDGLRGGTVAAAANLSVTSNTVFVGANVAISANLYITAPNTTIASANTTVGGGAVLVTSNLTTNSAVCTLSPGSLIVGANSTSVTSNVLFNNANTTVNAASATVLGGTLVLNSNTQVNAAYLNVATTAYLANVIASHTATVSGNLNVTGTLMSVTSNVAVNSANVVINATSTSVVGGSLTITSNTVLAANVVTSSGLFVTDNVFVTAASNANIGTTVGSPVAIFEFPFATYPTARLDIQVRNGTNVQLSEAIVATIGSVSNITVYGTVNAPTTTNQLATFTTAIVGANTVVYATQTTSASSVKVVAHLIK